MAYQSYEDCIKETKRKRQVAFLGNQWKKNIDKQVNASSPEDFIMKYTDKIFLDTFPIEYLLAKTIQDLKENGGFLRFRNYVWFPMAMSHKK